MVDVVVVDVVQATPPPFPLAPTPATALDDPEPPPRFMIPDFSLLPRGAETSFGGRRFAVFIVLLVVVVEAF